MIDPGEAAPAVRRATRADASHYAASLGAAAADAGWSLSQVETCLGDSLCDLWIVEDLCATQPLLGYLALRVISDELEVLSFAVLPEKRRRGLGRYLLRSVLDVWRRGGAKRVFLEVRASNAPARSLYEGLGFVEVGFRRRYYRDGEDAVVMRWSRQAVGEITTLSDAHEQNEGEENRGKRGYGSGDAAG